MTAWELLLRDFLDCVVLGRGDFSFFFFLKGKVDHCSLPTGSVVRLQRCMFVGYIIHNSVTEGRWWWMVACARWHCRLWAEPGSAASPCLFKHPRALFGGGGVVSFEKSRKRSYSSGELGDCGIGFVSVLCFVSFCFLSFTCSAIAVGTITYPLFLVSAKYSMVQWQ